MVLLARMRNGGPMITLIAILSSAAIGLPALIALLLDDCRGEDARDHYNSSH